MRQRTRRPRADRGESGATAVEYAVVVMLIALVVIGAVTLIGRSTRDSFEDPVLLRALTGS